MLDDNTVRTKNRDIKELNHAHDAGLVNGQVLTTSTNEQERKTTGTKTTHRETMVIYGI